MRSRPNLIRPNSARALLGAAALLVCSSVAAADTVSLRNGAVLEGRTRREGDHVVVVTGSGEMRLPAAQVVSVTPGRTVLDDYDDRLARLREAKTENDPDALVELARWCREKRLGKQARTHLRRAIELEPDHAAARKALGYIRHDGRWLTEAQYREARGFVRVGSRWVHRDELRRKRYQEQRNRELEAHAERIRSCVKGMSSPLRKPRLEAKVELQRYAEERGDLKLAEFASQVADFYNARWRAVRNARDRATALTTVRATWSELKRPIPTFQTSLGGFSTPVRIQLPELRVVSVQTTAQIPATIELDED